MFTIKSSVKSGSLLSTAALAVMLVGMTPVTSLAISCTGDSGLVTCSGGAGNEPNSSFGDNSYSGPGPSSEPTDFDGDDVGPSFD